MQRIFELVFLSFASVGVVAAGYELFRSNWGWVLKGIGAYLLASLGLFMWSPARGMVGLDHGPIVALFATIGIVIATNHVVRHPQIHDWRPRVAAVAIALGLLAIIWTPYLS